VVGALGAALGQMAINYTAGKAKFAEHEELYARLGRRFARAGQLYAQLTADDMQAFGFYQDQASGKGDVTLALSVATNIPREMAKIALAMLEDLEQLSDKCNVYLLSDLMGAAALAVATVRLSDYCVTVNCHQLGDTSEARELRTASQADLQRATVLLDAIEHAARRQLA
jgi:formiminotetrahydrofolate cyclodeaminase